MHKNGVFLPKDPVDLPEGAEVNFEPRIVEQATSVSPAMTKVYEILSRRYDGGPEDLAERHNEHQP
jgi:predicted DNA-binding antitoxin AbrB/MazE fold protein